ncbi:MAG: BatA domain-containing protein [Verrucomicrobiota bacterium]
MDLIFGNPLGFLALLGLPAVLLIHFLQRKARVEVISTLFLLENMKRDSLSGSRFERLRSSVPLWMQLLAVLLLTWLLTDPRWQRQETVQRIAVVLDSSSSMAVFEEKLRTRLRERLESLGEGALTTEFVVMETDLKRDRLYNGSDLETLTTTLQSWQPRLGAHDFGPALRVARSLVGADGLVIMATDHLLEELPYEAKLLSIGEPTENCGFAGLTIEEKDGQRIWRALIRNYGEKPATRTWSVQTEVLAGAASANQSASRRQTIEPGQTTAVQGAFPEGKDRLQLVMEPDAYRRDDVLPIIAPRPKPLTVQFPSGGKYKDLYQQVLGSFPHVGPVPPDTEADLSFLTYNPLKPAEASGNALIFIDDPLAAGELLQGPIVVENHPLVNELNWQALLGQKTIRIPSFPQDQALVWQGERPLIFLRRSGTASQLHINFDLNKSNATRLPAFVVLIHRFLESLRETKVGLEAANFETGQNLQFAFDRSDSAEPLTLNRLANGRRLEETTPLHRASLLTAPLEPGFFTVSQGQNALIEGAAHFADTREASFNGAASRDDLVTSGSTVLTGRHESDRFWRWWMLGLGLVLLLAWWFVRPRSPEPQPTTVSG